MLYTRICVVAPISAIIIIRLGFADVTKHPGMLSPRGQRGLKAKIFGLDLVTSGLGFVLVLMHARRLCSCPRCQSLKSRHLRYVRRLQEIVAGLKHRHCCDCHKLTGYDFLVLINFMLERKSSYTMFL